MPNIYDICVNFFSTIYLFIFKVNELKRLEEAIQLKYTMGDWYYGQFFTYLKIWGHNSLHFLLIFIPNKVALEEINY